MPTYIYIEARTKTALHIGAASESVSDSPFRRSGNGGLVIPGTSIAGALRNHLTRIVPVMTNLQGNICRALLHASSRTSEEPCNCVICHLMGDVYPVSIFSSEKTLSQAEILNAGGRASRLIVHDAIIKDGKIKTRDGVGIDRLTGAAARQERSKFDAEVIPADTAIEFRLELDDDSDGLDRALVALVLEEWRAGRIYLGGNTSRGLGAIEIETIQIANQNLRLGDDKQLMSFLRREPIHYVKDGHQDWHPKNQYHGRDARSIPQDLGIVDAWCTVDLVLDISGFFIANDTTEADAMGYNHYSKSLLPGSSLRGAIRSHAERIARTVANYRANNEGKFLEYNPASYPIANSSAEGDLWLESGSSRWRRNPDRNDPPQSEDFDLAEQLFGSTFFGSRLVVEDATLVNKDCIRKRLDFVAIDRFTGGAAGGAKFDAHVLWKPSFRTKLYLESPQAWEIGWLLFVLRDIQAGLVPLGFGASKGFGEVASITAQFTFGYAYPDSLPGAETFSKPRANDYFLTSTFGGFGDLPSDAVRMWTDEWVKQVSNYGNEMPYQHDSLPDPVPHDPYWFSDLADLYPK